jgi:hypothetical protein
VAVYWWQDLEVGYFHTYKDGVDFVFIDSPIFHAVASNIYGGSREEVLRRMILLCKAAVEVRLLFLAFDSPGGVGPTLVPDLYEKPGCY